MSNTENNQVSVDMLAEVKSNHPQLDKIRHYLEQGANISIQDEEGNTPIIIAVGNHNYKLVELLLAHGADINIRNNLRQTVFNVVKDDDIWHLLRRERELPTPDTVKTKDDIERERLLAAIERTKKEREGKPFDVSQLKLEKSYHRALIPKPSQAQIDKLEHHYGHPIPPMLKEIFKNYNGGRSNMVYETEEYDITISFFYIVDENYDDYANIWYAIDGFSQYLGSGTLPFADGSGDSILYLKWVEGKSQVWRLLYGGDMVTDDELDESDLDDPDAMPYASIWLSNSLEEFLENSYEDR